MALRTLALLDAVAVYDAEGSMAGYTRTLTVDDIVNATNGQVDRAATAREIAERHYAGFSAMGAAAQAKVAAYVQSQLPATIAAGTQLATLHAHIVLADAGMSGITQITDIRIDHPARSKLHAAALTLTLRSRRTELTSA